MDEKLPNCISSIAIYKDDDCIECTDYYEKSKNSSYKKYHFKYIGDRLYKTYWYENGNIESKEILAYNEIEALIFSLFMSEDGKMISKFEDKVYSYYLKFPTPLFHGYFNQTALRIPMNVSR